MFKKYFFLLTLLVLLTGCASTTPGPRFSAVGNNPDSAVVYVYRLHTPPILRKPDIKVGDVVVAELPTNSYTVFRLRPGTYTIKTDWGFLDNPILSKSVTLSVMAEKSYYVNFVNSLAVVGARMLPTTLEAEALSGEATAIPQDLTTCSYIAPRVSILGPQ